MPRHLFDTGFLTATGLGRYAISGGVFGHVGAVTSPAIIGNDPANANDNDPATLASLSIVDGANFDFLRIDLGSAQAVSKVVLKTVGGTGASKVSCYVSNTASLTNATPGTALAAAQLLGSAVLFDGSGAPVTGRYLYIAPNTITGAGVITIAEVAVYGVVTFPFAVLQSIAVTAGFSAADLRTTAHQTNFPIDVAHHSGAIMLDAKNAEIDPGALAQALACDQYTGVSWTTLKPIAANTPLPPLSGLFEGKDSNGKRMRLRCPLLYAPGAKLDFALGQFATEGVQLVAYIDPTTSLVASWEFEN